MNLPTDPAMLYSYLNTLLRDECDSFDALAEALDIPAEELVSALEGAGLCYDAGKNRVEFA